MADPRQVEQDLYEYLSKESNLRREDKIKYLKAIFNKHLEMDSLEHVISPGDLQEIVSVASFKASGVAPKLYISGKEVSGHNPIHIQMVEAVVSYMNKHSLLKRVVGFEYRR